MYFRFCGRRHVYMLRRGRREKLSILVEAIYQGSASPKAKCDVYFVILIYRLYVYVSGHKKTLVCNRPPAFCWTVGAARIVCV